MSSKTLSSKDSRIPAIKQFLRQSRVLLGDELSSRWISNEEILRFARENGGFNHSTLRKLKNDFLE